MEQVALFTVFSAVKEDVSCLELKHEEYGITMLL